MLQYIAVTKLFLTLCKTDLSADLVTACRHHIISLAYLSGSNGSADGGFVNISFLASWM